MTAHDHPFELPYIGLGLLDETTIRRDGDAWTADYPFGEEPYVTVRIEPDRVEIAGVRRGRRLGGLDIRREPDPRDRASRAECPTRIGLPVLASSRLGRPTAPGSGPSSAPRSVR